MKYVKKFVGEKVYLSIMHLEDAEKYVNWLSDRDVTDNLGNTVNILSVEQEKDWILNAGKNGDVNFAIVEKETDKLLGNCSLFNINRINRCATLGIFIGEKDKRGIGYGFDAINLILNYAFNIQNLHNVNLEVFSFNKRAINCYKKVGFKEYGTRHEAYFLDGKYHDVILMEILEDEYRKNKIIVKEMNL